MITVIQKRAVSKRQPRPKKRSLNIAFNHAKTAREQNPLEAVFFRYVRFLMGRRRRRHDHGHHVLLVRQRRLRDRHGNVLLRHVGRQRRVG